MIDYQTLLTEARFLDTKPVENHNMGVFHCGSTSCAMGDIALANGFGLAPDSMSEQQRWAFSVLDWLGLSSDTNTPNRYYQFLFSRHNFYTKHSRWSETPAETAARIRKFVYYRLRKAEIFAEYNETLQTGKHAFQCEHGASQESMTQANGRTRELTKVT